MTPKEYKMDRFIPDWAWPHIPEAIGGVLIIAAGMVLAMWLL